MKIVASVYNLLQLNNNIEYMDSALIMVPKLSLVYGDINVSEAIDLCKTNNVQPILALNKLFLPSEIEEAIDFILKYKDDSSVYFYITDLGLANIGIKNNIINRMIFNPETMITNTYDLIEYSALGFDSVAMSLEITLADLVKSYNEAKTKLFYLGFGHRLMFYSKRKLITLYENKNNTIYPDDNLYLRESTRNDFLPIIENENGTVIYRSYLISLLENIADISFLEYLLCESLYIDDSIYTKALKIFYQCNRNEITASMAVDFMNELGLDIQDGFKYKDSVYQKEELKG